MGDLTVESGVLGWFRWGKNGRFLLGITPTKLLSCIYGGLLAKMQMMHAAFILYLSSAFGLVEDDFVSTLGRTTLLLSCNQGTLCIS